MKYKNGISIVLATHNGSRFIREQLNSLVDQTQHPLEIIVSDDASTDDTIEIVQSILSRTTISFKIMTNNPALGYATNFLKAAQMASGTFVAFCDQDDIWDKRKIELCSSDLSDPNVSMIVHTAVSVDSKNRDLGLFRQGIRRNCRKSPLSYDPWSTFFGFSMIFRREILDLLSLDDRFIDFIVPGGLIAHDRWIMFLAQVVGETIEIKSPLVRYRQHADNLFGNGVLKKTKRLQAAGHRSDLYIIATTEMIDAVEKLPEATNNYFPAFNRSKAVNFYRRALVQLEERNAIYQTETRLAALQNLSARVADGTYRAVHSGRPRWRSIAKDFKYALLRR